MKFDKNIKYTFQAGLLFQQRDSSPPRRVKRMPKAQYLEAAAAARAATPNKVGKSKQDYEREHAQEIQLVKDGKYVGPPELWMKDYLPPDTVYPELVDSSSSQSE